MAGFNKIILLGNLTRSPELRTTAGGTMVCTMGLAVNRKLNREFTQDGEKKDEVCFVDVLAFGATAEHCARYLDRGQGVLIEGRLQQRRWDTDDGQKRSKHEVVAQTVTFLPKRTAGSATDGGTDEAGAWEAGDGR